MATTEAAGKISDVVYAELIECQPEPPLVSVPLPTAPDASPVQQALQATIEQTGADPPPTGVRHAICPASLTSLIQYFRWYDVLRAQQAGGVICGD